MPSGIGAIGISEAFLPSTGTAGQVLTLNSSDPTNFSWQNAGGSFGPLTGDVTTPSAGSAVTTVGSVKANLNLLGQATTLSVTSATTYYDFAPSGGFGATVWLINESGSSGSPVINGIQAPQNGSGGNVNSGVLIIQYTGANPLIFNKDQTPANFSNTSDSFYFGTPPFQLNGQTGESVILVYSPTAANASGFPTGAWIVASRGPSIPNSAIWYRSSVSGLLLPANYNSGFIMAWGPGGPGGAGARNNGGNCYGGNGGNSGCISRLDFGGGGPYITFGNTYPTVSFSIGVAGTAPGQTTVQNTAGATGTAGTPTTFTVGGITYSADAGAPGLGGGAGAFQGAQTAPTVGGNWALGNVGGSGGLTAAAPATDGGSTKYAPDNYASGGGGGGGGAISPGGGGNAGNGGKGGILTVGSGVTSGITQPAGGTAGGTGGPGSDGSAYISASNAIFSTWGSSGGGGGGGAYNVATANRPGGPGGAGGSPGGGGGGGGAYGTASGSYGGAGGAGGNGAVLVVTY